MYNVVELTMNNVRGISRMMVSFAPHVTVIMGDHGSGKTTLLRAIHKAMKWTDCGLSMVHPVDSDAVSLCHTKAGKTTIYIGGVAQKKPFNVMYLADMNDALGKVVEVYEHDKQLPEPPAAACLFFDTQPMNPSTTPLRALQEDVKTPQQYEDLRQVCMAVFPQYRVFWMPGEWEDCSTCILNEGRANAQDIRLGQLAPAQLNLLSKVYHTYQQALDQHRNHDMPWSNMVVLFDDIEQGLYPKYHALLLPALRSLFREAQLIVTAHSPWVGTSIEQEDEVVLLQADDDPSQHRVWALKAHTRHGMSGDGVMIEALMLSTRNEAAHHALFKVSMLLDERDIDSAAEEYARLRRNNPGWEEVEQYDPEVRAICGRLQDALGVTDRVLEAKKWLNERKPQRAQKVMAKLLDDPATVDLPMVQYVVDMMRKLAEQRR